MLIFKKLCGAVGVITVVVAIVFCVLITLMVVNCQGEFFYTLDDSYIHLVIAREIAHGHYGIQTGEAAAPSSSILWPILLAPFAYTPIFQFAPLILNIAFTLLGAAAAVACFTEIFKEDPREGKDLRIFGWALATVIVSNMIGLALTGMEHSFQVWLTILAAYGLICVAKSKPMPVSLPVALATAPLVRYENFALTLGACLVLLLCGRRREAVIALGVPLAGIVAFSFFLNSIGMGFLPSSVMAKSPTLARFGGVLPAGSTVHGFSLLDGLKEKARNPRTVTFVLYVPLVIVFALTRRSGLVKALWSTLTFALVAHLVIGEIGSYQRYQMYLYAFGTIALVFLRRQDPAIPLPKTNSIPGMGILIVFFALFGIQSLRATQSSPRNSGCIYRQQGQTMRFVRDFYKGPVAINDLGVIALNSGQPILDLWGLASRDALKARLMAPPGVEWVGSVVDRHKIGLVAIYDGWIPDRPANWTRVGKMNLLVTPAFIGGRVVSFYATPWANLQKVREDARRFAKTIPPGTSFQLEGNPNLDTNGYPF